MYPNGQPCDGLSQWPTNPFAPTGPVSPPPERGGEWWRMIPEVWEIWEGVTGGDTGGKKCWTGYSVRPFSEPCPDTPDYDAVMRAVERAPDADVNRLIDYLLDANSGRGPKSKAALLRPECVPFWVKAILGGKGCIASKFPEAPAFFLAMVRTYGAPGSEADLYPGSSIPPAGIAGIGTVPLVAVALALFFLVPALLKRR